MGYVKMGKLHYACFVIGKDSEGQEEVQCKASFPKTLEELIVTNDEKEEEVIKLGKKDKLKLHLKLVEQKQTGVEEWKTEIFDVFKDDMVKHVQGACGWGALLLQYFDKLGNPSSKPMWIRYCDDYLGNKKRNLWLLDLIKESLKVYLVGKVISVLLWQMLKIMRRWLAKSNNIFMH
eukprot:TRINITY_DN1526_c0_g1_i1.p1 TRINITY_DN1526_c0_g1~~TRINITY_DN1526_c0_g1_i1.p1  ORF type:complete len:177 (-),score=29.31 TRINITY_DN1526_c0_g1_i1:102-632(-)